MDVVILVTNIVNKLRKKTTISKLTRVITSIKSKL